MSNFKIIIIGIFAAAAVFGVLVFSGAINFGSSSTTPATVQGSVTVWGTFNTTAMSGFVSDFNVRNQNISIIYVQKDPASFDTALIEAIAAGTPPDLVLLPDNLIWRYQNKMTRIPFGSLPAQTFQSTFTSAADIFGASDGYIGVPWASDPLVMYYNRDMLQGIGLAQPPATWQAFTDSVPKLVQKQADLTFTGEAAALGAYGNIQHAKDILALLFFENGNAFITNGATQPVVHFGTTASGADVTSSDQALSFYMAFSDPTKPVYTWNAGEPLDRNAFTQSSLAYYFGTASELPLIRAQNPNLNFGIALPPQAAGKPAVTSGHVYGFAIPKSAPNQLLSYTAATLLASNASETAITQKTGADLALIPIRRDVLAAKPANDAYVGFLYDAAIVQKSWLDPNPATTASVFNTLIRDISSSSLTVDAALSKAGAQLSLLGGSI